MIYTICKNCGKEIPEGEAYCFNCGTFIEVTPVQYNQQSRYDQQSQYGQQSQYNQQSLYGQQPQYDQQTQYSYGQQPQYNQQPQYGQQPQYNQQPQYGQQPQYNQQPQYDQQPQYNQQSQYNNVNQPEKKGFFSDFEIATAPNAPGPNNGSVDFLTAIKLYFKNYTNFKGRASKSEYWWIVLFTFILGMIPVVGSIMSLFCIIPSIAVLIRRLHDTGKAGSYYFMMLIPIAGPILVIIQFLKDSDGDNAYGPANIQQVQHEYVTAQQYNQPQQYVQPQQYTQPQLYDNYDHSQQYGQSQQYNSDQNLY